MGELLPRNLGAKGGSRTYGTVALVGKTKRGKGTKWMVLVDGAGTPLAAYLDAASPAEVTLLEKTLASQPIRGKPALLGPPRPRPRPATG